VSGTRRLTRSRLPDLEIDAVDAPTLILGAPAGGFANGLLNSGPAGDVDGQLNLAVQTRAASAGRGR
jgi:hypothetical protein